MKPSRAAGALALLWAVVATMPATAYPRAGRLTQLDVPPKGIAETTSCPQPAGCSSDNAVVSANGRYVAFQSDISNLVRGDRNGDTDIFVRDLRTGRIARASLGLDGSEPDLPISLLENDPYLSEEPSISTSGRYVAFTSYANGLVPGDQNDREDVFVRDMRTRRTERVSVVSGGGAPEFAPDELAGFGSFSSSISSDGRYVAFVTVATNLGGLECGDNCVGRWIYRHDRQTDKTVLVSRSDAGLPVDGFEPSISGSGRYVAFNSGDAATADDTEGPTDVFRRDIKAGKTVRVSAPPGGKPLYPPFFLNVPTNGSRTSHGSATAISTDGRYVSFRSLASNLVPADTNGLNGADAFVRDMKTGRIERVSVSSTGAEGSSFIYPDSYNMALSPSGRYVVFSTYAQGLASPAAKLYIHDRLTGATLPAALSDAGRPTDCSHIGGPAVSSDGRFVSFGTCGDFPKSNADNRVYVYDRGPTVGVGGRIRVMTAQGADASGFRATGVVTRTDPWGDLVGGAAVPGADLIGATLAYRPGLGDIFFRADVADMPSVAAPGLRALYSIRFAVDGRRLEVRASAGRDIFELVDCSAPTAGGCAHLGTLSGGIGTVGSTVTVAVPLDLIGLDDGGRLEGIVVRTALGDAATLDEIRLG